MSLEQLQEYFFYQPFDVQHNFAISIHFFGFYCLLVVLLSLLIFLLSFFIQYSLTTFYSSLTFT